MKILKASDFKVGDKLKYFYNKGNINNKTVEFRGLIDGYAAVLREWKGFRDWIYYLERDFDAHLKVFSSHIKRIELKGVEDE